MDNIKKETLFITGAAGYVGAMLVNELSKRDDVERIIGLDKNSTPKLIEGNKKLIWIQKNTSDSNWAQEAAKYSPTIVIHTAWQIREMYWNKKLQWKWNIDGSSNVFDFAINTSSVKKLIHFSTVASYGAYSTNTLEHFFTEQESFRKSDYLYAEEKRIVEEILEKKVRENKRELGVSIIRPAAITGPRGRNMTERFGLQSALSGKLRGSFFYWLVSKLVSFVPITEKWCRQFVHEDDIADVVTLISFSPQKQSYQAFNLSCPGPVVLGKDMAEAVNKKPVKVSPFIIRFTFFIMWHISMGKIPTSRGGWKSYSYPIAVDGSKITKEYGYKYRMNSKDAFIKNVGRYSN